MPTAVQTPAQSFGVRQQILASAVPIFQNVRSGAMAYTANTPTNVNLQASPVGLIRRLFLVITGQVNCAAGKTLTPTAGGPANLLSNIQFTDQNNRLRINTNGWHLHLSASEKRRRPFGCAIIGGTGQSDPTGMGANFPVQKTTGAIAGGTPQPFTFIWEIPVVNSNTDLSGAIYANQTTSNNQLQFTLNPNFFAATGTDGYLSGYKCSDTVGNTAPTLTNLNWTLYQDFLDQLPNDANGFAVLPQFDMNYALCYQLIAPGGQVAGQDNLYALPPFNIYQQLMLFWDNYTYAGAVGSDVNYIKVQVSNTYVIKQWDALMLALQTRNILGTDMPGFTSAQDSGAVYSLDFRHKPLTVNQLSSTNIVFRPNAVQPAANFQIGQEYLWLANAASG